MTRLTRISLSINFRLSTTVLRFRRVSQSVGATGGVYKGQGLNQNKFDDVYLLGIPR